MCLTKSTVVQPLLMFKLYLCVTGEGVCRICSHIGIPGVNLKKKKSWEFFLLVFFYKFEAYTTGKINASVWIQLACSSQMGHTPTLYVIAVLIYQEYGATARGEERLDPGRVSRNT